MLHRNRPAAKKRAPDVLRVEARAPQSRVRTLALHWQRIVADPRFENWPPVIARVERLVAVLQDLGVPCDTVAEVLGSLKAPGALESLGQPATQTGDTTDAIGARRTAVARLGRSQPAMAVFCGWAIRICLLHFAGIDALSTISLLEASCAIWRALFASRASRQANR